MKPLKALPSLSALLVIIYFAASCTTPRHVYNQERSAYLIDLRHRFDSLQQRAATTARDTLLLRDTLRITQQQRGDTVYITTTRTLYRDRVVTRHDTVTATRYIERQDSTRRDSTTATTTTTTTAAKPSSRTPASTAATIAILILLQAIVIFAVRQFRKK